MQQLLTESVLVALGGGRSGCWWRSGELGAPADGGRGAEPDPPRPAPGRARARLHGGDLSPDCSILFGLAPALRATRVQLATALRAQGRGVAGALAAPGRMGLGKLLVVAQVALSTLLLVGTGMLVRSTQRLESTDVGIARDQLVIASIDAQRGGYEGARLAALIRDVTERVRQIPGVADASVSENGLFSGTESGTSIQVEGFVAKADADTLVAYDDVGPRYFNTIGARLLQGRDFDARDNETGAKVAVVNESMAKFFFPKGDAMATT